MLCPVFTFVVKFGGDIGTGILVKGGFDGFWVGWGTKFSADLSKTAQSDKLWEGFSLFLESPIYNKEIESVRELAGFPIITAWGNAPKQVNLSVLRLALDPDTNTPLF